ncbi:MAG: GNAT family N-acetyltransferase [Nitrososphaerales archaeon]
MRFKEVNPDMSEFRQAVLTYSSSFPPAQAKSPDKVRNLLKNDSNYHLYVAMDDQVVAGISLLYTFKQLSIGLLDYMAIAKEYQRMGRGSELFKYTISRFTHQVSDPVGLLLEIQKEDVADAVERTIRHDRIKFYDRLGVKTLRDVYYLLPPQSGTEPEEMYLMILPLKTIDYLPKSVVLLYIDSIYSRIYQYHKTDLLDIVASRLPDKIKIAEISL